MGNKILVVVESLLVEESSGAKANLALIQNLHRAGFEVFVCHYSRKDISLSEIPTLSIPENRSSFLFFLSRLERLLRYKLGIQLAPTIDSLFGFSFTLFNDRNSIVSALKTLKDFDPDLVLTLSQGASFRPHHALLRLPQWHGRWMAYIHDPYPLHSYPRPYDWVEPGHQKKRNFFLKVAEKAEYAAYPSKLLAEWMESYYGPLKGKRLVIPHQLTPLKESKTTPSFLDKNKFSIVHSGTLLGARNPLSLVRAFIKFLKNNPEAQEESQLIFLGPTSIYHIKFQEFQKDLPQLYFSEGYVPFSEVTAVMKAASVNVILEAKGPISPFLPGKFPHCIQVEKPILLLGPYYSESRRLFGEEYPWWSEIDDEERICKILEELYVKWRKDPQSTRVEHTALYHYLGPDHLREVLQSVL